MEEVLVSSVVGVKDQAKLTVSGVPDQPGVAAKIFTAIADKDINVDMIIQNISVEGVSDISLTVPMDEAKKAVERLKDVSSSINAREILVAEDIGKVSVIGVGMRSHTGVAAKMFKMLADAGINIEMISTSEIKVSCVVKKDDVDNAVKILHKGFGLDKGLGSGKK